MPILQGVNGGLRKVPTWILYGLAVLPPAWLLYQGLTGGLGVDPVKVMEHKIGLWGLQVLIAGLCITPLCRFTRLSLIRFRRALGLIGFFYILLHLLVWLFLDVQIWTEIWKDIVKRPYITVGMLGFAVMVPLAVTSNDLSVRKLGASAWRRLHKLTYLAVLAGGAHYLMQSRGFQLQPLVYLAVIFALLALRIRWKKRQRVA